MAYVCHCTSEPSFHRHRQNEIKWKAKFAAYPFTFVKHWNEKSGKMSTRAGTTKSEPGRAVSWRLTGRHFNKDVLYDGKRQINLGTLFDFPPLWNVCSRPIEKARNLQLLTLLSVPSFFASCKAGPQASEMEETKTEKMLYRFHGACTVEMEITDQTILEDKLLPKMLSVLLRTEFFGIHGHWLDIMNERLSLLVRQRRRISDTGS